MGLRRDVTLQHAHDLSLVRPFSVRRSTWTRVRWTVAHGGEHGPPQRMVRLRVPSATEPLAVTFAS